MLAFIRFKVKSAIAAYVVGTDNTSEPQLHLEVECCNACIKLSNGSALEDIKGFLKIRQLERGRPITNDLISSYKSLPVLQDDFSLSGSLTCSIWSNSEDNRYELLTFVEPGFFDKIFLSIEQGNLPEIFVRIPEQDSFTNSFDRYFNWEVALDGFTSVGLNHFEFNIPIWKNESDEAVKIRLGAGPVSENTFTKHISVISNNGEIIIQGMIIWALVSTLILILILIFK